MQEKLTREQQLVEQVALLLEKVTQLLDYIHKKDSFIEEATFTIRRIENYTERLVNELCNTTYEDVKDETKRK